MSRSVSCAKVFMFVLEEREKQVLKYAGNSHVLKQTNRLQTRLKVHASNT